MAIRVGDRHIGLFRLSPGRGRGSSKDVIGEPNPGNPMRADRVRVAWRGLTGTRTSRNGRWLGPGPRLGPRARVARIPGDRPLAVSIYTIRFGRRHSMDRIIDHIEITVRDMKTAVPFYDKLLPLLGFDVHSRVSAIMEQHDKHVVQYENPRLGFAITSPRTAFAADMVNRRKP